MARSDFDPELVAERYIRHMLDCLDTDLVAAWLDNGQSTDEWHDEVEAVCALLTSNRVLIDWNY
jgi:hypothetical protein